MGLWPNLTWAQKVATCINLYPSFKLYHKLFAEVCIVESFVHGLFCIESVGSLTLYLGFQLHTGSSFALDPLTANG
jgi:hypothetical protein